MDTNRIAVVVHVYKSSLSGDEKISLRQLHFVLNRYPVVLTAPEGLDVSQYKEILGEQMSDTVYFSPSFFKDLKGYNRLLLSRQYYAAFASYDYILLHHTDAFVFRDELEDWASKGYDNIGAPIYEFDNTISPEKYICSGNGGLCLRKVSTFINLAGSARSIYNFADIRKDFLLYNWKGRIARAVYYFSLLTTLGSRLNASFNRIRQNEDIIWGYYVPKHFKEFRNASFDDAYKFSMEFNAPALMKLNNMALPFGCHGWFKPIFKEFWKPYIDRYTKQS